MGMTNNLMALLLPYKSISATTLKAEEAICVEFANTLRQMTLENKLPFVWYHIANEFLPSARRNYSFDLKQKHMGKISGVPDYCFMGNGKSFFIEFKAGKGRQTPAQKAFEEWCRSTGVDYHLCRSSKEGIEVVNGYVSNF
jgi:hypothetical protein